jgi:alpha-amylase
VKWIDLENPVSSRGGTPFVGLFMDYETFGEHQWASTGIFDFMRVLPARLLKTKGVRFITPTEAVESATRDEMTGSFLIDAPEPFSWADVERDLSAWRGNPIQDSSLRMIYRLEKFVKEKPEFLETWRRLQTSDHFYYMCTKYFADGDVHKYFNPFDSPYDAHIIFMNVMADLSMQCGVQEQQIA